jgi:hypothetical protein
LCRGPPSWLSKYTLGFVRIAAAQVFKAEEGFELVIERRNFGAGHFAGERNDNAPALEPGTKVPMMRVERYVPRPNAVGNPRRKRKRREKDRRSGVKVVVGEFFG